jgi:L-iditol 2-dehydrogenase
MKALQLLGKQQLQIIDRPMPECAPGELLIKIHRAGICRTDRKAYFAGQRDMHYPRILGHEMTGTIAQIGQGVYNYQIGERIVVHPGVFCQECQSCQDGLDALCVDMQIFGFHLDGGFAEYLHIPAKAVSNRIVIKVPEQLPLWKATLTEPLACAIHQKAALADLINFSHTPQRIAVIGAGALGILTAKLWQNSGNQVALLDIDPKKVSIARGSCSNIKLDVALLDDAFILNNNSHFDIAIVCCPGSDGFTMATELLRKRGNLGFFSGLTDAPTAHAINQLHYKELRLAGSYGCNLADSQKALALLETLDIDQGLIKTVSLTAAATVITTLETDSIFTQISFVPEETNDQ